MMRVLSLFAGIGGFDLGLQRTGGFKTIAFCEIEPFCRRVLAKHWPGVPILGDVAEAEFPNADVVCGGFPCQDVSAAGQRAGLAGTSSGLWRHLVRAIRVVRPRYAIVENVAALLHRGMGTVLGDLAASGYDTEWDCIPASAVGTHHIRDRVWIVAYPTSARCEQGLPAPEEQVWQRARRPELERLGGSLRGAARIPEPEMARMADALPEGMGGLRALGNAVVPQVPELIGRAILAAEAQRGSIAA